MNVKNTPAYELVKEQELEDIQSRGYLLRHKKSNARILLVENEDENKVFDITFRTPPCDSTGVAHILEHSVLCGSKHFPLKDPFVELVKGSLNTFLNAMTFPDKTTYPVASCNEQDFQNLMHVYLDAVFFPNIYEKEEIFRQEGWSYQLEDPQEPLCYNGVVYNEMKGAFSTPDEVLDREVMNSLFPDTTYGYESGGDPSCITDLKYSEFLDFHSRYYHPSNSYLYLYGNMDMEEKLDFIDREYLSLFDAIPVDSAVKIQEPFDKMKVRKLDYPITESESEKENTYLAFNAVTKGSLDIKLNLAFEVLVYALLNAPGAPLKQALLDAHLGKDVYGSYDSGICQPFFSVVSKNANAEDRDKFLKVITDTLKELSEKGINKKSLEAGINYFEFRYREADYASCPKGLMYCLDVLEIWLYDDSLPLDCLCPLKIFDELKKEISGTYFEQLIRKYLLENTHTSLLVLSPQKGLAAKREQETAAKLKAYKNSLTPEQLQAMAEKTKALARYQEQAEEPEALKCIPMLKREDINPKADKIYNEERQAAGSLFLCHPVFTNGIGYVSLLFDTGMVPQNLVPYLGILPAVLGNVDTKNYTFGELFNEINARTGGIQCGNQVFESLEDNEKFTSFFGIRSKALYPQMGFVFQMIEEILGSSKLEDEKRLYEIISQIKSRSQVSLVSAGNAAAVLRATSYGSAAGAYQEEISGIAYYKLIEDIEEHFEEKKQELIDKLKALMVYIFRPENLKISFTGEEKASAAVEELCAKFKGTLCTVPIIPGSWKADCQVKNEGFETSAQVQFVAQTGNFRKAGLPFTGTLGILKVILSYDYLWMNLRVKGGAYGCVGGFKRNGEAFFASYRDPHLGRTLEVYQGIPEYVRNFSADEREMTKYIIGTISSKDVPKTPQMEGNFSESAYFLGVTEEMLQKERDEILKVTVEDIRKLADYVEAALKDDQICVIGSEAAIEGEKELFKNVTHLFN